MVGQRRHRKPTHRLPITIIIAVGAKLPRRHRTGFDYLTLACCAMARNRMADRPRCLKQAALVTLATGGATSLAPAAFDFVWLGQAVVTSGWPLWSPEGPLALVTRAFIGKRTSLSPWLKVAMNRTHLCELSLGRAPNFRIC